MPKPFPFPLNIGTDICSIPRIRAILLKSTGGPRLVKRILTERECLETRSRWEAPVERYWQAQRRKLLLTWKRDQLGFSKNWTRTQILNIKEQRGWLGDAEKAKLLEDIERDEKAEIVDDEVGVELDGDSNHPENETSEDTESSSFANTKVVAETTPREDAKKGKLSDKEALLLLMEQNLKEIREAEVGMNLVAQFMAGRWVPISIFASSNFDSSPSLLQNHTKQICLPDSQPKKRLSKHITIADSPITLSQSTNIRANHSTPQTACKARKHPTPWSSQSQEVGKMPKKLNSVSAMMAIMLQLCVWHMNLIHPRTLKYQRKMGGNRDI
jgi:hypothetical protein